MTDLSESLEKPMSEIVWPLLINKIRGGSVNNTFGMLRKFADGTPSRIKAGISPPR